MFRNLLFRCAKRQIHVASSPKRYNLSTEKIIKPSTPTHSSLKRYNLSPFDQISPSQYMPFVFYYQNRASNGGLQDIAGRLKRSLSETLVQYYPFAGRLNSPTYVDCNDEGVEFQEVNVERQLSEILEKTDQDDEALGLAIPKNLVWGKVNQSSPLLVIRLSNFECGGVSMAVCLSHKLGDAKTCHTFMNSWATKTRRMTDNSSSTTSLSEDYSPYFVSNPPADDAIVPEYPLPERYWSSRRFVFPNSKITKLKEMVANKPGLENPTRVEILNALLHKCVTSTITINSGAFCPTLFAFPMNVRHKMLPPLPETTIGNIFWPVYIPVANESENNLDVLIDKFKKAKREVKDMNSLDVKASFATLQEYTQNNYKLFWCTSLSRLKLDLLDFGWGNPSRVILAGTTTCNNIVMTDTPNGDGLEALVSLDKEDMATFECDKEIVEFTS